MPPLRSVLVSALVCTASPALAGPITTWEFTGTVTTTQELLGDYVPVGSPVILDVMGNPAALAAGPSSCPSSTGSADFLLTGGLLRLGSLTYALESLGYLERENEAGYCGAVGAPLDIMAFDWRSVGTPPVPALADLFQVYLALDAANMSATTLGDQLAGVEGFDYGSVTGPFPSVGGLTFTDPPVPTPEPATCALLGVGLLALAWGRRR